MKKNSDKIDQETAGNEACRCFECDHDCLPLLRRWAQPKAKLQVDSQTMTNRTR
jgi:hypothetical protein